MTHAEEKQGRILQILRMSTEDGPSARAFFSRVPAWLPVVPQSRKASAQSPQIQWLKTSCIGCGLCVETCPEKALEKTPDGIGYQPVCLHRLRPVHGRMPHGPPWNLGRKWSVPDRGANWSGAAILPTSSSGGVTLSGGEAALQHEFCLSSERAESQRHFFNGPGHLRAGAFKNAGRPFAVCRCPPV